MSDYKICDQPGPCWDGYVYVGPKPRTSGSCISKDKLCKKKRGKGTECKPYIKCDNLNTKTSPIKKEKNKDVSAYKECLISAEKKYKNKSLSLCPEGYCTAKHKFEVYPSAYANGYASQVCKGSKPNYLGETGANKSYLKKIKSLKKSNTKENDLTRWYKEAWVNVCEKGDGPGGFAVCGSGKGIKNPKKYPYCRAYYRLPGTKVVTAQELTKQEIKKMCKTKRSLEQGIDGKPTRITLSKNTRNRVQKNRKLNNNIEVKIPKNVKKDAEKGLELLDLGFSGGTETGINRAKQLAFNDTIPVSDVAVMRAWFARHGPDAKNGGTSYPGYCKWIQDQKPTDKNYNNYRGAVAWLIWGGDAAYKWIKSKKIREVLKETYPKRKESTIKNNLTCD